MCVIFIWQQCSYLNRNSVFIEVYFLYACTLNNLKEALLPQRAEKSASILLLNPCFGLNLPDVTVITKAGVLNITFIVGTRGIKASKQNKLCSRRAAVKIPFLVTIYSAWQVFSLRKHNIMVCGGYQTCHICVPQSLENRPALFVELSVFILLKHGSLFRLLRVIELPQQNHRVCAKGKSQIINMECFPAEILHMLFMHIASVGRGTYHLLLRQAALHLG